MTLSTLFTLALVISASEGCNLGNLNGLFGFSGPGAPSLDSLFKGLKGDAPTTERGCLDQFATGAKTSGGFGRLMTQCFSSIVRQRLQDCDQRVLGEQIHGITGCLGFESMANPWGKSPTAGLGDFFGKSFPGQKPAKGKACDTKDIAGRQCRLAAEKEKCNQLRKMVEDPDCNLCQMVSLAMGGDRVEKCVCKTTSAAVSDAALTDSVKGCVGSEVGKGIVSDQLFKQLGKFAGKDKKKSMGFLGC